MLIKGGYMMKQKHILIIGVAIFLLFVNVNSVIGYSEGLINENESVENFEEDLVLMGVLLK